MVNKTAKESWNALDNAFDIEAIQTLRTDNEGEFQGVFHENCRKNGIKHPPSTIPDRSQTNARAERWNRTLEGGMKCQFEMSKVPYIFWGLCALNFTFHYARVPTMKEKAPYELRFGKPYDGQEMHPFGCGVRFLNDQHKKFDMDH